MTVKFKVAGLKKIRKPIYQKYKIKLKIVIFWRKSYNTTHSIIDIVHQLKVVFKIILEVFKHFWKQKISPFTFHAFAEYIYFLQSFTIKLQFFNFYNFMSAESFIKVQFKSQIKQVLFLLLKEHVNWVQLNRT